MAEIVEIITSESTSQVVEVIRPAETKVEVVAGEQAGPPGVQGPVGPPGPGVPAGGVAGQILLKTGGADYATDWVNYTPTIILTQEEYDSISPNSQTLYVIIG